MLCAEFQSRYNKLATHLDPWSIPIRKFAFFILITWLLFLVFTHVRVFKTYIHHYILCFTEIYCLQHYIIIFSQKQLGEMEDFKG